MSKTTLTKYGVAEGERIIGDLFDNVKDARRQEAWVKDTKTQLGEESTARLVTVEVTTTYGRPHVYREPDEPGSDDSNGTPATEQTSDA